MGHDGVPAIDDSGIVPSLIEHTHVDAQVVCQVDGAVHGALVGADDHQVILINL